MSSHPPSPERAADEGLLCLTCDYNLSGLTEDRCPECGNPFDRTQLRLVGSGAPMPVRPWDDRAEIGVLKAFWRTCLATWLRPAEFSRTFPAGHSVRSAWAFSGICYAIAGALYVSPMFLQRYDVGPMLMLSAGTVLTAICCEELLATILALLVTPKRVPRSFRRHFWRGLMHFSGNFLIVTALATVVPHLVNVLMGEFGRTLFALSWLSFLFPVLYWWVSLARAVQTRTQSRNAGLITAIVLIPVAGILSYVVCTSIVMMFAFSLT